METGNFLNTIKGEWLAIGGNRWIDSKTAKKVEVATRKAIRAGCKIVTGGAEGADHEVMKACLKYKIPKNRLKIFLPYTAQNQYQHYLKLEGEEKAKVLLQTILKVKALYPEAIIENHRRFLAYRSAANFRNSKIVRLAQAAIMFSPKGSLGTGDALKKIDAKRIPYIIFK